MPDAGRHQQARRGEAAGGALAAQESRAFQLVQQPLAFRCVRLDGQLAQHGRRDDETGARGRVDVHIASMRIALA
jgi:hypothetical protein